MAVPTITSISPATGPAAGGNIVEITGTNFKIPTLTYTVPATVLVPTVSILINGETARNVGVISATRVRVLMPRYTGDPRPVTYSPVSIVLSNLDSLGAVILGETVTYSNCYTYETWIIGAPRTDPPVLTVYRYMVGALMREVCKHVSASTHVDFGDEGTGVRIDLESLPNIGIRVSLGRDVEWVERDNYNEEIDNGDGTVSIYNGRRTLMMNLDLTLSAEGEREAFFMVQAVTDFVTVNPLLNVPADSSLYPGVVNQYPVEIYKEAVQASNPGGADIVAYVIGLRVRGIETLPDWPIEKVRKILAVTRTETNMDGENPIHWAD